MHQVKQSKALDTENADRLLNRGAVHRFDALAGRGWISAARVWSMGADEQISFFQFGHKHSSTIFTPTVQNLVITHI